MMFSFAENKVKLHIFPTLLMFFWLYRLYSAVVVFFIIELIIILSAITMRHFSAFLCRLMVVPDGTEDCIDYFGLVQDYLPD